MGTEMGMTGIPLEDEEPIRVNFPTPITADRLYFNRPRVTMATRRANLQKFEPGIYRGGSNPIFGLWRLRQDGIWLFCVPVEGKTWVIADDQTGANLTLMAGHRD